LASGWCIPKFHNLSHIVTQIWRFGPPKFWDVEHGESNHKFIVKEHAVTCQKRGGGVFLDQLSQRIWGMQTFWLMMTWLNIDNEEIEDLKKGKVPGEVCIDPNKNSEVQGVEKDIRVGKTNVRITVTVKPRSKKPPAIWLMERTWDAPIDEVRLPRMLGEQLKKRKRVLDKERLDRKKMRLDEGDTERDPIYNNNIDVAYEYHTKTSGCTFPNFGLKWFRLNYTDLLSPGEDGNDQQEFDCFTEIKHKEHGHIRCHPNYQGDGPWRDWVLLHRTNKNSSNTLAQVLAFVRSHKHSGSEPDMVLVRTTYPRNREDISLSSVLFHRWRKGFDKYNDPTVELVPIKNIKQLLGVVDENPEMVENRHGIAMFLNSDEEREQLRLYNGQRKNNLCHDIVWQVRSIAGWAGEFLRASRFCKNALQNQMSKQKD
jgi:hypothetical protein